MALDTLDYDYQVHFNPEADKNLAIKFYLHPLHNEEKSLAAKRPIYDDMEFIEIRVRGDKLNIVQRPAREDDKVRFRAAYKAFQDNEGEVLSGTPLKEWPSMSKSMIEELKYFGFHTVEQLAEASDTVCSKFAGLQHWKQRAKLYVEYALKSKPIDELESKMRDEQNRREVLEKQNEQLAARLAALEDMLKQRKETV